MLQRRHLQIDGHRLSFLEQGTASPQQPSLVLLHGLMGSAETFVPLLQALSPGQHVIAVDLPGAGHSERNISVDPSLRANARCVSRLIQTLQLDRPVLLGHSHGGAVATWLAATHPGLLRSLVLFAPAHPYFHEGDPLIRFYLSLPGRLFAYSMPWYPQWLQMIGLRRMAGPQSWDSPDRLRPYRDNLRVPGTIAHLLRLLAGWKSDMAQLGRLLRTPLATPTQLVWGDCDRAVPLASAEKLRQHLRISDLQVLRGVGHRPAEEQPELSAALIQDWMHRILPAVELEPASLADRVPSFSTPQPSARPAVYVPAARLQPNS